jgi:hypothetical protein
MLTSHGLPSGIFQGLRNLEILHLHRNPLSCSQMPLNSSLMVFRGPPSCPQGCSSGTFSCYTTHWDCAEACSQCPAGKYSEISGMAFVQSCVPCTSGKYSQSGATTCTLCPPNTGSPAETAHGGNCTCIAGFTGANGGPCHACPAGSFKDVSGSGPCISCPTGTFSTKTGAGTNSDCLACEVGKWSQVMGATSPSTCIGDALCDAGKYWSGSTCLDCEAGSYSEIPGRSTACSICPPGTWSAGKTATCTPCGDGKYSTAAGATSPSTCSWCDVGKWSPFRSSARSRCYTPTSTLTTPTVKKSYFDFALLSAQEDFTLVQQSKFRNAIAVVTSVSATDVTIDDIRARGGRRNLLSTTGIVVKTSITTDEEAAKSLRDKLTANLNAELRKARLPTTTLLEEDISFPEIFESVRDGGAWLIIATIVMVIVAAAILCHWRRRRSASRETFLQVTPVEVIEVECGKIDSALQSMRDESRSKWALDVSSAARETGWSSGALGHQPCNLQLPHAQNLAESESTAMAGEDRRQEPGQWVLEEALTSDSEDDIPPLPIF